MLDFHFKKELAIIFKMEFWSATKIAREIRERRITSLECVNFFIDRISRLDGKTNAVVVKLFAQAREQAQR